MAGARRTATIAAASVVALCVAAVAVFSTYQDYATATRKARDTADLIARAQALFAPARATGGSASATRDAAVAALTRRPMDSTALAQAGFAMAASGRSAVATPLMVELVRRDPRSMPARYWFLSAALRQNDVAGAVSQLDRLMVIARYNAAPFFPALAELAKQPRAEAAFADVFSRNPEWRDTFLSYLTATGQNSGMVFRLASHTPAEVDGVKSHLIQKMIDAGQYDAAYLAWVNFLPETALGQVAAVYDGGFAGLSGLQPFNWTFNDSDAASVGIERGEGLQIDYPAAQTVRMVSQTLVLKPGQYRLVYSAHGSAEAVDGGGIAWRIACLPDKAVLLEFPVKGLGDQLSAHAAQFTVPDSCKAQMLSLEGTAGTFPQSRSLSIRRIAISPVAS